jgi:hypothetical protein
MTPESTPEIGDVLRELEASTDRLLERGISELESLSPALERRARAIAGIASCGAQIRESELARLNAELARGDEVAAKIGALRQDALAEWARLNRIAGGLETAKPRSPHSVDCSG